MVATLALSLVMLAPAPADTLHVGDRSFSIPVGADTIDNYVVRGGEEQLVVTYVQTITEVPEGYLVVQENISRSGASLSLDSLLLAEGSLATAWHGDVTPNGRRHVAFTDGRVRGISVDSLGTETPVDAAIPPGLFDYSVATLVADHLPLESGYEATLATYDITRGPAHVSLAVVAVDTISVEGGTREAWRMEVAFDGRTVTRWIDRMTRRELEWVLQFEDRRMIGRRR